MRLYHFCFAVLFLSATSKAQTNTFPSSGNVGVGTLSPENAEGWDKVLEIYGTAHSKLLVSTASIKTGIWSNTGGYYGAPAGGITGTVSNYPFSIVTNGSPKVSVMPNGSIGIGTVAPIDLLEINTGSSRRGITLTGDGDVSAYSDIQMSAQNKSSIALGKPHTWDISHRKDGYFSDTPIGESSLEFYAIRAGGGYFAPLSFKSNGDVILASNKNSIIGNVGIGTTTPRERLSVNGNIRAKEIKVEAVNWPDYVFTKDYVLPSLKETEKHIKETGHLSGIPSASEVKSNGIDLGDMNAKLLKKIEELTLYIIDLEKRVGTIEAKK